MTKTITAPATATAPALVTPIDTLRAAMAAYDAGKTAHGELAAHLSALVLERYAYEAQSLIIDHNGVNVLPDSERNYVKSRVILAATGRSAMPTKDERGGAPLSPALTSLGQYVSRYGTVATNLEFGTDYLESVESAKGAYSDISEGKSASKTAKADNEWNAAWATLTPDEYAAIATTIEILSREGMRAHVPAFIRTLPKVKG